MVFFINLFIYLLYHAINCELLAKIKRIHGISRAMYVAELSYTGFYNKIILSHPLDLN